LNKYYRLLRYDLPLFLSQGLCSVLPDNVIFLRLRGFLIGRFLGSCGRDFRCGRRVVFYNPANIHVGGHVYIAYGCWLNGGATITIHDEVMFGPYCVLSPSNHTRMGNSFRYGPPKSGPISIGKGSWLGAQVVVLRDVRIGSGSVIAANTTVRKDVPDNVVYGQAETAAVLKHLGDNNLEN
jgi:acetyltransferase-like isoleucine patch superfamily enzyme